MKAGESAEIGIGRMHGCGVFHCQGSDVCVGDEVGPAAGYVQVSGKDCQVVIGWVERRDVVVTETSGGCSRRLPRATMGVLERGVGHQSNESRGYRPRYADCFISL